MFGKKRKKEEPKWLDQEVCCLFCGKSFPRRKMLYVLDTNDTDVMTDQVYENFRNDFLGAEDIETRRWLVCEDWIEIAEKEKWTSFSASPALDFHQNDKLFAGVRNDNQPDTESSTEENFIITEKGKKPVALLCPECHCVLPEDFDREETVRIALYGGKRSGKTAYMTMATNKLVNDSSYHASCLNESDTMFQKLMKDAENDFPPTVADENISKIVFPMALSMHPTQKQPFYLIFHDIPGEYAEAAGRRLVNQSSYALADALLAIIDINMFVNTKEREKVDELSEKSLMGFGLSDEEQDYKDKLEMAINTRKYSDIYGRVEFAKAMQRLDSVQIVLTKVDRWYDSLPDEDNDNGEKKALETSWIRPRDHVLEKARDRHRDGIDVNHLENINGQIPMILNKYHSGSNHLSALVDNISQTCGSKIENSAYCAVQTRGVTVGQREGSFAGNNTINILDPVMNVLRWKNLWPLNNDEKTDQKKR